MYHVQRDHKGPLCYFQVASPQYNFLYTKKVDKVEPNSWFRLWFLAKGGFEEDVRAYWSMANSTLHAENFAKTQGHIDKLRDGFPETLPHEVFCDRDGLIKAGLTKGADYFPKFTLLALLSRKHASGNCIMPHKVAYKSITSKGKEGPEGESFAVVPSVTTPPEATPFVPEAVVEAFEAPSPRAQDPITIVILDWVSSSLGKSDSSSLPPSESASGSDGPWLPTPYTVPSGVTVTEDTISKVKLYTTSLLMKNYMLRKDVTECAYGLSLKWKEAESSLAKHADEKSSLEERLNEALSRDDNAESKYQDLLARSLEESQQSCRDLKAQLNSSQLLLAGTKKRLEELSSRPSPEAFKKSDTYRDLLINNLKEFSSEVYPEFRGIHSLFPEFVDKTFGNLELTHSEEEDTESTNLGDDDAFAEDAPSEDAPVA
ncbi:hypothetical protein LIER_11085 [Lithospermum erythrorhizon]|uniref:Uncharacterized protein n=1 Tax=Lithospermum erythrorhizon TaxID=34254 RepID=A0AAV3PM21_LITER